MYWPVVGMTCATPHSVLPVLLRLVRVCRGEGGVPPGGHGEYAVFWSIIVSVGGFWHSLSVPLPIMLLLLIVFEFSGFLFWSIQLGVARSLTVGVQVWSLDVVVLRVWRR